ncbi:MAG: DUF1570 domain-containing protein [Candidatus Sumerlaeaceae bacterium]|nr:DUF1570 domain-containing protein [Candidatus Sumerlaeaceae bacterium]
MSDEMVGLSEIEGAWMEMPGLPRPAWPVVTRWIRRNIEQDNWEEAYDSAVMQWLEAMVAGLSPGYEIHESPNFFILAAQSEEDAIALLKFAERTHRDLMRHLCGGEDEKTWTGRHVILLFNEPEVYADYVASHSPGEDEQTIGLAVMINRGYIHTAAQYTYLEEAQRCIAHEHVHTLIHLGVNRKMPRWLHEGLAQLVESAVFGSRSHAMDAMTASRHRSFWNRDNIQQFWSGDSFNVPGDSSELSYNLAVVIARVMAEAPDAYADFIREAHRDDAGESAAQDIYGKSLGDYAFAFLGPGDWAPQGADPAPDTPPDSEG